MTFASTWWYNQLIKSVLSASPLAKFKHSLVRRSDRVGNPEICLASL